VKPMGILLRWTIPSEADVTYDKTYIYRADSKTGTYTQIAVQDISDNVYFDKEGTTSHWYKIRYYDSQNDVWSSYSEPLQGGTFYGYCSIDDIRMISGLTSSEISDSQLYDLLEFAMAQLNSDINVKIVREKIEWLDDVRENKINGENKTYYVKYWKDYYIGDLNNDGTVNTDDVIVYQVDANDVETQLTVSSVSPEEGKFELASAPESTVELYVTYARAPLDEQTPHPLIKLACAQLTAALAFTRLDAKKLRSFRVGKIAVTKQSDAYNIFYNQYRRTINQINILCETGEGKTIIKKRGE